MKPCDYLLLAGLVSLLTSFTMLYYVFTHANGKKNLRLLIGILCLYISAQYLNAFFSSQNFESALSAARPFVIVLLCSPMWEWLADSKIAR